MAEPKSPAWLPLASLFLCVAGIAVASYLTYEHYTGSVTLSCPSTGAIDCIKVTTSSYSKIFGIPVAVLGLAYFVVMVPFCLPAAWRSPVPTVHWVRGGIALAGIGFVAYLLWAELFRIDAICLWCTGVHIITLLLFVVICVGTALITSAPDGRSS